MQSQYEPPPSRMTGARCAVHVEAQAIATCTRCGTYACAQCTVLGPDREYYCQTCISKVAVLAPAPRTTRLLAQLVDSLVMSVPLFVAMGIFLVLMLAKVGDDESRALIGVGMFGLAFLMSLGVLGYQAYQTVVTGQSIGKRMMGIRVVRNDGSQADFVRVILLRNVVPYLVNLGCGLFWFVDVLFIYAEDQRCLHDHIADTRVVKVDDEAPPSFG
ncbi:RDD family protein [Archangium lansingense]|uniref:RDD family protein n=1 Tax=Archangium lansingense TaxID=2995310 RepID=A0ABT4A005_9BACT|nr:RDD family protein [Archangium lansinium]MCY1074661.1 RDD family protein [Archangium lansinium]